MNSTYISDKVEPSPSPTKERSKKRISKNINDASENSQNEEQQILDFIGPSGAVKELFALPYKPNDGSVSVAVHNIGGGMLLLDGGDDAYITNTSSPGSSSSGRRGGGGGVGRVIQESNKDDSQSYYRLHPTYQKQNYKTADPISITKSIKEVIGGSSTLSKLPNSSISVPQHRHVGGGGASAALSLVTSMLRQVAESDGMITGTPESPLHSNNVSTPIQTKTNSSTKITNQTKKSIINSASTNDIVAQSPIYNETSKKKISLSSDNLSKSDASFSRALTLNPPEYYSSNIVRPPVEPRQYLSWKFHDMNFLIASDAIIYRPHQTHNTFNQTNTNQSNTNNYNKTNKNFEQHQQQKEHDGNSTYQHSNSSSTSQALTLRIENANDFRQQVRYFNQMVHDGPYHSEFKSSHNQQISNDRTSYAEAVRASNPTKGVENKDTANDHVIKKGGMEPSSNKEHNQMCINTNSMLTSDLEQVKLQTCIIPSGFNATVSTYLNDSQFDAFSSSASSTSQIPTTVSPVCTCLDAYLDNIMANVPQLALCLQEKGFIQSVKLLRTEDIPTHMMVQDVTMAAPATPSFSNSTPESSIPSEFNSHSRNKTHSKSSFPSRSSNPEPIFSPSVVDLNATMLLRFLKDNCSTENSTYLLRRNAGEQNIQLYDVTSISSKRQRKWTWWLAMMSYRFALRLAQLSKSATYDPALKRTFRARERSLLQTSLDLLMELADMDGGDHETIRASVNELLADTFLGQIASHKDMEAGYHNSYSSKSSHPNISINLNQTHMSHSKNYSPNHPKPQVTFAATQPYSNVKVDGLNKAQDYITCAIRTLYPLLEKARKDQSLAMKQQEEKKIERSRKRNSRSKYIRKAPTNLNSKSQNDFHSNNRNDISRSNNTTSLTDLIQQMKQNDLNNIKNVNITSLAPTNSTSDVSGNIFSSNNDDQDAHINDEPKSIGLEAASFQVEAVSMQLFGLHHKLINISLRLAEHHLQTYWSSTVMQALRTSARKIAESVSLLSPLDLLLKDDKYHFENNLDIETDSSLIRQLSKRTHQPSTFLQKILKQYSWLWEYCGHFARSFAADDQWRERGHASGEDVIALLQDVESACRCLEKEDNVANFVGSVSILKKTNGQVTLSSLNGIVLSNKNESKGDVSENVVEKPDSINAPPASVMAEKLLNQQSQLKREKRRVLIAAVICYSRAVGTLNRLLEEQQNDSNATTTTQSDSHKAVPIGGIKNAIANEEEWNKTTVLSLLRKRLGDACNEIGKALLSTVKELLGTSMSSKLPAAPMLESAQFWFQEGLEYFELCSDLRNIALLRCNLCQCCKIGANAHLSLSKKDGDNETNGNHAEECLQEAAEHLQKAHSALIQRDEDPKTWDMVSEELAATFLVLGVRRRQSLIGGGTTPVLTQALRLTPGKERSVVQPMEQALEIYEKLQNAHQAAAAHYQLALFYAKIWTCQRNEYKTREKLSSAFLHYSYAHRYFFSAMRGNEPTFVILSLDLSNLYSSVSGAECLKKALTCCLDTCGAFSPEAAQESISRRQRVSERDEWFEKMNTLAQNIEDRIMKLLLNLVKFEKEDPSVTNHSGDKFEEMYRDALKFKISTKCSKVEDSNTETKFKVYELLSNLKSRNGS